MTSFYTVDRIGRLSQGLVLDLQQHSDITPAHLKQHVDELFPHGVSMHGERYFVSAKSCLQIADPAIELTFEYVRRAYFADRPSRYASFFGWRSEDDASEFRKKFGQADNAIWEVECDHSFVGNMQLLRGKLSILSVSYLAHEYWAGRPGPPEFDQSWECVLTPPVRVVRSLNA